MWSVFKLLDPDPDPYIVYWSGSGSRRANNIRILLDPDPQHCQISLLNCNFYLTNITDIRGLHKSVWLLYYYCHNISIIVVKSNSNYYAKIIVNNLLTMLCFFQVLRIRDVYPGSRIRIFPQPGSRISDRTK